MYFSRIAFNANEERLKPLIQIINQDYYLDIHKLLYKFLFTEVHKRPFIYHQIIDSININRGNQPYCFYIVSKIEPTSCNLFNVEIKSYEPFINDGRKFKFNIRINPSVKREDGKIYNVLSDARKRIVDPSENVWAVQRDAAIKWFINKSENYGFKVEPNLNVFNYYYDNRVIKFDPYKKDIDYFKEVDNLNSSENLNSNLKQEPNIVTFASVDFQGILTVTNSEKFRHYLYNGIGRQLAYGCGLLLIKPI